MKLKVPWVNGRPCYQRSVPPDLLGHQPWKTEKLEGPLGSKPKQEGGYLYAWQVHQKHMIKAMKYSGMACGSTVVSLPTLLVGDNF